MRQLFVASEQIIHCLSVCPVVLCACLYSTRHNITRISYSLYTCVVVYPMTEQYTYDCTVVLRMYMYIVSGSCTMIVCGSILGSVM